MGAGEKGFELKPSVYRDIVGGWPVDARESFEERVGIRMDSGMSQDEAEGLKREMRNGQCEMYHIDSIDALRAQRVREGYLDNLWRWSAGVDEVPVDPRGLLPGPDVLVESEWCGVHGTRRRRFDRLNNIYAKLEQFEEDENLEHLVDIRNQLMMLFVERRRMGRKVVAVDDEGHMGECAAGNVNLETPTIKLELQEIELGTPERPVYLSRANIIDEFRKCVRVLDSLPINALYAVDSNGMIVEVK